MDLQHLQTIGFTPPRTSWLLKKRLALDGHVQKQRQQTSCPSQDFDTYLPNVDSKQTLLQKLFKLPTTPTHIDNIADFLAWLSDQQRQWPELASVQGGPAIPELSAFSATVHCYSGDIKGIDADLEDTRRLIRETLCASQLCEGLMLANGLWDIGKLDSVEILAQRSAPLPQPLCGSGRFNKLAWVKEYDGKAFLSVDMREANFSSLRIMARLVDPCLSKKLSTGWSAFLDNLLGSKAKVAKALKPLREIVLGSLERYWFRSHADLQALQGLDPSMRCLSGSEFVDCALNDEPNSYSPDLQAACAKAYKQMRGRISQAYTAVEHAMVAHVMQTLLELPRAQLFCRSSDEVLFLLDTTEPGEAEQIAGAAAELLGRAFSDNHLDLAGMFRVEVSFINDVGSCCAASSGATAMAKLTRRLLPDGSFDAFAMLKGVRKDVSHSNMNAISASLLALRQARGSEWSSWLKL